MSTLAGETNLIPVNNETNLEQNYEFVLQCDVNSFQELTDFISNPIMCKCIC